MKEPTEIPEGVYVVFKDDKGWCAYFFNDPRIQGRGDSLREAVDNLIERIKEKII